MAEGLTTSDVLAMRNYDNHDRYCDDGMFGGNGSWVFFLFFLLAWGGGGFGWGNNRYGGEALTQAEMQRGFDTQSIISKLDGINNGLCDGFYSQNTTMLQGFNGVGRDMCTGFNGVTQAIAENRYAQQQCCCETNRNIDAVRYENSRNTCDIVNAIREDGNATRALINANTMQDLRDKLAERDRDVLTRDFQLSQQGQTASLINELRPCPIPAYLSCSPYQTYGPFGGYGYGGCGNGCGCCNNGFVNQ